MPHSPRPWPWCGLGSKTLSTPRRPSGISQLSWVDASLICSTVSPLKPMALAPPVLINIYYFSGPSSAEIEILVVQWLKSKACLWSQFCLFSLNHPTHSWNQFVCFHWTIRRFFPVANPFPPDNLSAILLGLLNNVCISEGLLGQVKVGLRKEQVPCVSGYNKWGFTVFWFTICWLWK